MANRRIRPLRSRKHKPRRQRGPGRRRRLGGTLKKELQAAIQAGGPIEAISVCNERAPEIAESISIEKGLQLGRVSLRNRSPGNVPDDWKKAVLEDFESRKAAGEAPDTLVYRDIVATDGGEEFRMMKAIPTASLCLTCHGTNIDPELAAKIDSLYPDDKAKGFSEGDLRGAFWVTSKL
ncbi:MAG: DUF3365 domain-containing protein [Gammaproteobacteria bacterium]